MQGLPVRLLALSVLGTVARCEEVMGLPNNVVIERPTSAFPLRCRAPPVSVSFNSIKVPGHNSDVVYRRVSAIREHFEFAVNATVNLTADNFVDCAKAAGSEDVQGFTFDGVCTGFYLDKQFSTCRTGDWILYIQSMGTELPVVTTYEDAPYEVIENGDDDPYRQYMLSAFVDVDDDHPEFETLDEFDGDLFDEEFVFLGNQAVIEAYVLLLDVNVCLTDGTYGLPVLVGSELHNFQWPIVYFFHECGKTVKVPRPDHFTDLLVFSHPGFGCKYYPTWLPDECTVTFESEEPKSMTSWFGFYFSETNSDDAGLIMTITGGTETQNVSQANTRVAIYDYSIYTVSLLRQPSKRAIGFFLEFF